MREATRDFMKSVSVGIDSFRRMPTGLSYRLTVEGELVPVNSPAFENRHYGPSFRLQLFGGWLLRATRKTSGERQ